MMLHRKQMRLEGYDYAQPGAYFVTICVYRPIPLLGRILDSQVQLNAVGHMILSELRAISSRHAHVKLDAHIVMPDHVHALLLLNLDNADGLVREMTPALPQLIQGFKSMTARRYGDIRLAMPKSKLPSRLWQRGYYDRIMRSEEDLNEKRMYILTNPQRWRLQHPTVH